MTKTSEAGKLPLRGIAPDAPARTIKAWREEAFMSQREFAAALGISNSALSLWERGHRVPRHKTLRELAVKIGIRPQQIALSDSTDAPDPKVTEAAA